MPNYQTLLPKDIYPFLDSMTTLYSLIEKDMHVAILRGDKISAIEKSLQGRYQVDSTTVRNVYHDLKGKHQSIKELRKTQVKDLKSSISGLDKAIKTWEKRSQKKRVQNGHCSSWRGFLASLVLSNPIKKNALLFIRKSAG